MTGRNDQPGGAGSRLNGVERELWQRSLAVEVTEEEDDRFLDLAGFAEGRLDPDEHDRVAERLAHDPEAGSDVAAARALGGRDLADVAAPASVIARASALVENRSSAWIIAFPRRYRPEPTVRGVARWAGLAAALVVASWLGFDLGSMTSNAFAQPPEDSLVRDMLDPSTGFVRDLTEGVRT